MPPPTQFEKGSVLQARLKTSFSIEDLQKRPDAYKRLNYEVETQVSDQPPYYALVKWGSYMSPPNQLAGGFTESTSIPVAQSWYCGKLSISWLRYSYIFEFRSRDDLRRAVASSGAVTISLYPVYIQPWIIPSSSPHPPAPPALSSSTSLKQAPLQRASNSIISWRSDNPRAEDTGTERHHTRDRGESSHSGLRRKQAISSSDASKDRENTEIRGDHQAKAESPKVSIPTRPEKAASHAETTASPGINVPKVRAVNPRKHQVNMKQSESTPTIPQSTPPQNHRDTHSTDVTPPTFNRTGPQHAAESRTHIQQEDGPSAPASHSPPQSAIAQSHSTSSPGTITVIPTKQNGDEGQNNTQTEQRKSTSVASPPKMRLIKMS